MKINELRIFYLVSMEWHSQPNGDNWILVLEILDDNPNGYFMAQKPTLPIKLKKRLRYYQEILN